MPTATAAENKQLFMYFVAVAFVLFRWPARASPDRGLEEFLTAQRRADNRRAGRACQ